MKTCHSTSKISARPLNSPKSRLLALGLRSLFIYSLLSKMTAQLVDNEVEWLDRDVIEEIIEDMQDDFGDITKGICSNGYLTIRF